MIDLVQEYDSKPKILNLSRKTVVLFQKYIIEHDIPEEQYYESVAAFIETTRYTTETKKGYRNRLRRFLYRSGIR